MTPEMYIFAGGGTGGHLIPALAVAEQLSKLRPEAKIVFACSDRPIDRRILDPLDYAVVAQPVRPLPRSAGAVWPFLLAWRRSNKLAKRLIKDLQPVAVLGTGGFAAGPVIRQAARASARTCLLNPDAIPGKANRYLSRHVDAIFTQFESTRECFPPTQRDKVERVGCPVPAALARANRADGLAQLGLRPDRKTLLIVAGSLGAANINRAVAQLRGDLEQLADQWQVLHVAGGDNAFEVEQAWTGSAIEAKVMDFCDRMDMAYAAADLVLGRAGAASIAELAATATPAVLMPYPYHRDRQQELNAAGLSESGQAVVVTDATDPAVNAAALRDSLLTILVDPARLEAMKAAASGAAATAAAGKIAAFLAG